MAYHNGPPEISMSRTYQGRLAVKTPWSDKTAAFKEDLKENISWISRQWDKGENAWLVNPDFLQEIRRLLKKHFGSFQVSKEVAELIEKEVESGVGFPLPAPVHQNVPASWLVPEAEAVILVLAGVRRDPANDLSLRWACPDGETGTGTAGVVTEVHHSGTFREPLLGRPTLCRSAA